MTERAAIEVVTLGECLIALVAEDSGPLEESVRFVRHVAGAEANVCVGLARLGHRSALIGRLGGDGFGRTISRRLRGEGVDISSLAVDPDAPTGLLIREHRALGASEVVYHRARSAGSRLSVEDVASAAPLFTGGGWLHLTGITPALSVSAREAVDAAIDLARDNGRSVSLDLNMRRKLWSESQAAPVLVELIRRVSIVFGDEAELGLVAGIRQPTSTEAVVQAVRMLGPRTVVAKLGPAGALAADEREGVIRAAGRAVPLAIDPVGAGDGFVAGYLSAMLDGLGTADALERGNLCGAAVVGALGDMTGLPTRAELELLARAGAPDVIR